MRIVLLVNNLTSINSFAYGNHIALIAYTKKFRPDVEIIFMNPHRMAIDTARNMAANATLVSESDYLMFLDDDVLVPEDTIVKLLENPADVQAALVMLRGYPFQTMAWKYRHGKEDPTKFDFYNDLPLNKDGSFKNDENGNPITRVTEADGLWGVGFSCALIKREVLQVLPKPWFVTGASNTEDAYFCAKIHEYLDEVTFALRLDIQCGHLMNPEPIEWKTKDKFLAFYKDWAEAGVNRSERPLGYIEACKAEINAKA